MDIIVYQAQGKVSVTVLHPIGDLDASTYKQLIAKAQEAYQAGARDFLIDLKDVAFLSSAGVVALHQVALLLRGEASAEPESGWEALKSVEREYRRGVQQHIKLLRPQPGVERTLELTGFKQIIEIYSDFDEAVASF